MSDVLVGKYRLEAQLGGGGMAEVFAGSTIGAEGFTRKVAIKRVLPGFSDDPEFAKMFVAEAQISSRLVHPNIVSTIAFDRDEENRLFLVMELVDGKTLDELAKTGLLPFNALIYVAVEVLRGLGYVHGLGAGVVHRDVSPHNVLLSWEGAVKVSDFGIAKARDASTATASTVIKGKPAYMSPEQANGEVLDGRSDLFTVGVMLWELLVGRRLFVGEDTRGTLAAVLFGTIPRPRSQRPDVPRDLERVVMKLLEREKDERYPTAEAAVAELVKCVDVKGGRDALIGVLRERFAEGPQPAAAMPSVLRKRRRWLVVAAVAVVGSIVGGVVAMSARSAEAPEVVVEAAVADTSLDGHRTLDARDVGPECTKYLKEMERDTTCPTFSSEERRASFQAVGQEWTVLTTILYQFGNLDVAEPGCAIGLKNLAKMKQCKG